MLGTALPAVLVLDLDLVGRKLVAGTFGRGMYEYTLVTDPVVAGPSDIERRLRVEVFPNPFRDRVTLRYGLVQQVSIGLAVLTSRGGAWCFWSEVNVRPASTRSSGMIA